MNKLGWKRRGSLEAMTVVSPAAGQTEPGPAAVLPSRLPAEEFAAASQRDLLERVRSEVGTQDPADELYREGRRALNQEDWSEAGRLFMELRERYARSAYVGDAYYFEAFARYRQGSRAELERALGLLTEQGELFPDAATAAESRQLRARVEGQLARRGSAEAAARVQAQAAQSCEGEGEGIRSTALSALLQMDPERAMPILREVLRERGACSAELRRQAVFLVSQQMTPETVEILLDLAHRNPDPDPEVREAAIFWLSQVDDPAAADALISILESGQATEEVQERVVFALAQQGDARSLDVLREYARRPDAPAELRENAIFWIGQTGGGEAFLRDLYDGVDDPELRERILFSVAQTRSPENREWLVARALDPSEGPEVRQAALFWASQAGLPPSEVVRIYRTSEDRELREHAISVLGQSSAEDRTAAVDAMMEIARTEEDPELREQAVFWLGQTDDPRVPEFLLELIRGG
ncbi:MAG: HEAT repeat domain-containing protein [Gemmatimonadota bacterium]